MSYKMKELLALRGRLASLPSFGGVGVAHLYSFLCFCCMSSSCVLCTQCCHFLWILNSRWPLLLSLTFIRLVSCVPNVATVSVLSILDFYFEFR